MDKQLIQLQVFYEIAMTIGNHRDLHPMLKNSLLVYLRNLGCASGLILRAEKGLSGEVRFMPELSIPRVADQYPACRTALARMPDRLETNGLAEWMGRLPIIGSAGEGEHYYVLALPGFGVMVLIKGGEKFDHATLKSLEQVNLKLAESCIACLQNERIEKINRQLSEEVLVRRDTEARLKKLTDELEQRVTDRTRELEERIDEIRVKEQSLQESEVRYRTLMEATPDPVVVYDMEGRVIFINPAFTKVFGWRFDEMAGKVPDFVPEKNREETQSALKQVLKEGYCHGFESRRKTKDGTILNVSITAASYRSSEGILLGFIVNLRDITELKKTQDAMIQTEKMVTVGGLAAGMAHEINNPLAGILQNIQVIENRLFKTMPANEKAALACGLSLDTLGRYMRERGIEKLSRNILTSGKRAAKIVDDMLSFSRNEPEDFTEVRVDQVIGDALMLVGHDYDLKNKYDFRHIHISEEYRDEEALINCVPNQVQQVIFNILKNAAQAMGKHVENPEIKIRTSRSKGAVFIEIEDNGPGIKKELIGKVFEPFFTTKKVGEGTGLGLSVSYFIIKNRHNGDMVVSSTLGKGTVFKIKLPCKDATYQ